jgi:hypothetical protein
MGMVVLARRGLRARRPRAAQQRRAPPTFRVRVAPCHHTASTPFARVRLACLHAARRSTADFEAFRAPVALRGSVHRTALWCESAWPGQAAHPAGSYKYS